SRQGGMKGLGDEPRSGRPPEISEADVVVATLANDGRPPERLGITHWSARFLAAELGISFASVARIWRKWKIQPHRIETFKFSTDPELEAKIRDVVGLYLDPPDNAVVVSVDEKSQIQALDRTAPMLPLRPGLAARRAGGGRAGGGPPAAPGTRSAAAPPLVSPPGGGPRGRPPPMPAIPATATRSSCAS